MNPVVERYQLIDTLDHYVLIGSLVLLVFAAGLFWCNARTACKVIEAVVVLCGVGYLVWRFFFAWKGIYYP